MDNLDKVAVIKAVDALLVDARELLEDSFSTWVNLQNDRIDNLNVWRRILFMEPIPHYKKTDDFSDIQDFYTWALNHKPNAQLYFNALSEAEAIKEMVMKCDQPTISLADEIVELLGREALGAYAQSKAKT